MSIRLKTLGIIAAVATALSLAPAATSSDPPGNSIGDGTVPVECPADINRDGFVDVEDLVYVIQDFGCYSRDALCRGDCNRDFYVDTQDIVDVILAWGAC